MIFTDARSYHATFVHSHAVNAHTYARSTTAPCAQLYFELDAARLFDVFAFTRCAMSLSFRDAPTRSHTYSCIYSSLHLLFIQVHRETIALRNIFRGGNPRITVKGELLGCTKAIVPVLILQCDVFNRRVWSSSAGEDKSSSADFLN